MANNTRQTGPRAASAAGKTLASPNATKAQKSAAAGALAQTGSSDQTGLRAASAAGKTFGSAGATKAEKSAAASALAQTRGMVGIALGSAPSWEPSSPNHAEDES